MIVEVSRLIIFVYSMGAGGGVNVFYPGGLGRGVSTYCTVGLLTTIRETKLTYHMWAGTISKHRGGSGLILTPHKLNIRWEKADEMVETLHYGCITWTIYQEVGRGGA